MRNILIASIFLSLSILCAQAQELWNLKSCIEYAIENNIELQQSKVQIKQNEVQFNSAKNKRLPSLNASLGVNGYFGRGPSRDGTYIDNTQFSSSTGIASDLTLYNGSSITNNIKARELNLQASIEDLEAAKESVSLQITQLYMQILYYKELLSVAQKQVELSENYVEQSKVLFDNGRASEGDYLESVATLSSDKLAFVEANGELKISLLSLQQALNLNGEESFDIQEPDISNFDLQSLSSPSYVYDYAVENRPHIKSAELYLQSLEYEEKIAQASGIPRVSLSAGYSNSYFNNLTEGAVNTSFREQMRLNGSENIGLSISIPIFNQFSTRNQKQSARLNIENQNLRLQNTKLALRKEIEQAYQNAEISKERYLASMETTKSTRKAFEYTKIKASEGRSNVYDFNEAKTQLIRSQSEASRAKYQYLFNVKILNFYLGKDLYFRTHVQ